MGVMWPIACKQRHICRRGSQSSEVRVLDRRKEIELWLKQLCRQRFRGRAAVDQEKQDFMGEGQKRVCIVTGTHGDELEGQYVCFRWAQILEKD
jgi:hypothetical protein